MAGYEKLLGLVKEHLDQGEDLVASVYGTYECKILGTDSVRQGIFVATYKRIVFYAKKIGGHDLESFPYEQISSFEHSKSLLGNSITFFAAGNKVNVKWINKGEVDKLVAFARKQIGGVKTTESSEEGTSIPDLIKKLADLKDQGILTEEEFSKKKTDLLSKM